MDYQARQPEQGSPLLKVYSVQFYYFETFVTNTQPLCHPFIEIVKIQNGYI